MTKMDIIITNIFRCVRTLPPASREYRSGLINQGPGGEVGQIEVGEAKVRQTASTVSRSSV